MADPAAILLDLSRARALFQQRTILAVIGHHTGDRPMTAATLQDRLRGNPLYAQCGVESNLPDEAADALDAAQARVDELAMMIRMLVRHVPDDKQIKAKSVDYLRRHGLEGSPFRKAITDPPASDKPD